MELDENSMSGYYEGDVFVFTQATLDKLCILGDAYAPCFEGAKIMSTYAKQYNEFAATVEDVIGRRYYVLNGKLEPKPEKFTLQYALQLGWNLTDAVYMQMHLRGMDNYSVQGIYSEGGGIFCILQDNTSLEFLRCDLEITTGPWSCGPMSQETPLKINIFNFYTLPAGRRSLVRARRL